jgi:hypothetical protein
MNKRAYIVFGLAGLLVLSLTGGGLAYRLTSSGADWHVFSGGGAPAGSANVSLNASLGQTAIGPASSASYSLHGGYWRTPAGEPATLYLPLVLDDYVVAPDLVVGEITATPDGVTVVVRNQGSAATSATGFWVDVYVDPDVTPTSVNQTWDALGDQGLVWGVEVALAPGEALTLTLGGAFYWPSLSDVSWPLALGTPVYAQVDSTSADTTYGGVLERDEIRGDPYNNIAGTTVVAGALAREAGGVRQSFGPHTLPSR